MLHHVTPRLVSPPLSTTLGHPVHLKMEAWQPVGSFKLRGIGALCEALVDSGVRHLISSSGGNAGLAAAYAGQQLDTPVTVVVPQSTPEAMCTRIRALGATVEIHGSIWDEAHQEAMRRSHAPHAALVHPFDDPRIWAGHATLIEECANQGERPGCVVVAVGGGGLLLGILEGLDRVGWRDVPVIAVETEGAASLAASLDAGHLVTLPAIRSIAKSLGAATVAEEAWKQSQRGLVRCHQVTDQQALKACRAFAEDHRVLVEPACGAALAVLYERHIHPPPSGPVLAVVCGGAAVGLETLAPSI